MFSHDFFRNFDGEWGRLHDEVNSLFSGVRSAWPQYPAVNLWANDEVAMVAAELPGIDREALDISVLGDTVTLSGKRTAAPLNDGQRYHRRERLEGEFHRTIQLPFRAEAGGVDASFADGVLTITLPRAKDDQPRRVKVNVG